MLDGSLRFNLMRALPAFVLVMLSLAVYGQSGNFNLAG